MYWNSCTKAIIVGSAEEYLGNRKKDSVGYGQNKASQEVEERVFGENNPVLPEKSTKLTPEETGHGPTGWFEGNQVL